MDISLSPFAPEKLVSRDRFGRPVPRQPAHLHTKAEPGAYLRDSSRFDQVSILLVIRRTREKKKSRPRSRQRIWFRETGSVARPASACSFSTLTLSLLLMLAGFLPFSATASIYLHRQPSSSQSRVYQVTRLRIDGVHCRGSAGTGPVVLNAVRVTGAAFSGTPMDQFLFRSLFPHPILVEWICTIQKVLNVYRQYSCNLCSNGTEHGKGKS